MPDQINLSITCTPTKLRADAQILLNLADIIEKSDKPVGAQLIEDLDAGNTNEKDPADVFGKIAPTIDNKLAVYGGEGAPLNTGVKTPSPPVGVELDDDCLPWDTRINPASRLKLKKTNTWKQKRGLDAAFVEKVQAELRATMGTPAVPDSAATTIPSPPASNVPPPPGAANDNTEPAVAFNELTLFVSDNLANQRLSMETFNGVLREYEIPSLPMLQNRPDKWDAVKADLDAALASTK